MPTATCQTPLNSAAAALGYPPVGDAFGERFSESGPAQPIIRHWAPLLAWFLLSLANCRGQEASGEAPAGGGSPSTGGSASVGGATSTGGSSIVGGTQSFGGTPSTGGNANVGSNSLAAAGMSGTPASSVEVYSWWISPGEAEALAALVSANKVAYPNDRIINSAVESGANARSDLAARMATANPPDLFQGNVVDLPSYIPTNPGKLATLDGFIKAEGLDTVIMPEILKNVTVGGSVYAIPNDIHRENSLYYNKAIFAASHLAPPTTVTEFISVCDSLKAGRIVPVATSFQGWIVRIMFNSLAMGSMGARAFHDYMAGGPRDDVAFGAAVDLLDNVLTNYVNADASNVSFGWTQAADAVQAGRAAMFFHGDWTTGYYIQSGWTPGTDFGVIPPPGAPEMFWYGVDDWSLPLGATNPEGAKRFLRTIASRAGQVAFNNVKGSTPIRSDITVTDLNPVGQATYAHFKAATYKMLAVTHDAWDIAWGNFVVDHDKVALMRAYANNPPLAQ